MSEHTLSLSGVVNINFGATGTQEILQNVSMILASVLDSCPMDRKFAWDGTILDRPMNVQKTLLASRLIAAVNEYEPRAQITEVLFAGSDGKFKPTVKVRIIDG